MTRVLRFGIVAVFLCALAVSCKRNEQRAHVVIDVRWPGAHVSDVERSLTMPIERAASAAEGVERVSAVSLPGVSRVRASFGAGVDTLRAISDVRTRIDPLLRALPPDVDPPILSREEPGTRPAYRFVAPKDAALVQATDVLRALGNQLERVPGVARVEVEDAMVREWLVALDVARLAAHGLTSIDVADAVRRAIDMNDSPAGQPRVTMDAMTLPHLSQVTLRTTADGAIVRLADVAIVQEDARPATDDGPPGLPARARDPARAPSLIVYVHAGAPADIDERIAGETLHARSVLGPGYDFVRAQINAREGVALVVTGPEHATVRAAANALVPLASQTKGVRDVGLVPEDVPELRIEVDRTRAAQLGVDVADVARAAALAMGGEVTRTFGARAGDDVPVRVRTGGGENPNALRDVNVRGSSGLVPLDAVLSVRMATSPARLERSDGLPALWVCAGVDVDGAQDDVVAALRTSLATAPFLTALPAGVSVAVQRGCSH